MEKEKVMSSRHTQHLKEILREIERLGGHVENIVYNKHVKIFWSPPDGRKLIQVIPASPGSTFGLQHGLRDIRRYARGAR
jgi:hypothetical protein